MRQTAATGRELKTLFLQAPSFEGFDGGAGSRYQAKREVHSFWYPTWLAQPAALVPNSRLLDAPADRLSVQVEIARRFTADCRSLGILFHGTFILGLSSSAFCALTRCKGC